MHTNTKSALAVAGLATAVMVGVATTAAAQAPDTNERTRITVDSAIEIPNATLQPGSYWFELVDSDANRHTVRVQNADESTTIATLIAVPIYRQLDETKGDTELVLSGTGNGAALDAWFFPGKQYGHQFVYPKDQARQIAERNKHVVLADGDGTVVRLNAGGITEPWAPDTKSSDRAKARGDSAVPGADDTARHEAVGTSGRAEAASTSAADHLSALTTLIDEALAGSGSSLTIDRATLQQMKSHVHALQAMHDK